MFRVVLPRLRGPQVPEANDIQCTYMQYRYSTDNGSQYGVEPSAEQITTLQRDLRLHHDILLYLKDASMPPSLDLNFTSCNYEALVTGTKSSPGR